MRLVRSWTIFCLPLLGLAAGCGNLPARHSVGPGRLGGPELAQKADVNAPGGASITPLASAAREGNLETMTILLKAGFLDQAH